MLMLFVLVCIVTICFMLIRMLPMTKPMGTAAQIELVEARWKALGYEKPLLEQYVIYLRNIFTELDFGTSWYIQYRVPALEVITSRLLPTVLVNFYSLIISTPIGIIFGIYAAIKKNKWQDHFISTAVMIFVSIPSYVYAFLVQYIFAFMLDDFFKGFFPLTVFSLADAGGSWFTFEMFRSMLLPVMALSFGSVAGLCRFTRAELTESLTSEYMLLARAKGLTRAQATTRHALKNAMVPILPTIISSFIGILGGSFVIESIFSIPGVGALYIKAINGTYVDFDVFMVDTIFYTVIGLAANIVVDISYGFLDPRIRMGER